MRCRRGEVTQVRLGYGCCSLVGRVRWSGYVSPPVALAGLVFVCVAGLMGVARAAAACPNAAFRSGASAGLPDCRAYELVTPADKGRTQALTFTGGATRAVVAGDGERVALEAPVPLGPNPDVAGARAVFSRTAAGWEMSSAVALGASGNTIAMALFTPDLSQVAFHWETVLNDAELSPDVTFEAGPVGGPYALMASIPREDFDHTQLLGASADFGDVVFGSVDHELPLSGTERVAAEATDSGALDLYDFSGGRLQLVNVKQDGSLLDPCGAVLGAELASGVGTKNAVHAVSEDGSKVFFTVPGRTIAASGPGCKESTNLFMRVGGSEPVEVSAPGPGVKLEPSEILPVRYNWATPDGSKVFFNTETALTAGETTKEKSENKLFEYDTEAPEGERLKLVASGVLARPGVGLEERSGFFFSEDGSAVYVESANGQFQEIYRYDTSTGKRTPVAISLPPNGSHEPSFSTLNGEFFLFTSKGVEGEPRGAGHGELYRYDNASESVMCVTCGTGAAPAQGEVIGLGVGTFLETEDETPALAEISEDGQEVFFQTTARLVPQDTNSTETEVSNENGTPGLDVYEWEADGAGGCGLVEGCTFLLSSGEDVGPARLLGASRDGRNVFFETAAQLAPQDTDELPDIYDARVDGGFAPPPPPLECLSCQGVGSPSPLFSPGASGSFTGAGNPAVRVVEEKPKVKKKRVSKANGGRRRRRGGKSRAAGHGGGVVRVNGRAR